MLRDTDNGLAIEDDERTVLTGVAIHHVVDAVRSWDESIILVASTQDRVGKRAALGFDIAPQLYWLDVSKSTCARITHDGIPAISPAISADNRYIAFLRPRMWRNALLAGPWDDFRLVVREVASGREEEVGIGEGVHLTGGVEFLPRTPDAIIYSSMTGIVEIRLGGTSQGRRLFDNGRQCWQPRVSPDGSLVAFWSQREGEQYASIDLCVISIDGEWVARYSSTNRTTGGPLVFGPDSNHVLVGEGEPAIELNFDAAKARSTYHE